MPCVLRVYIITAFCMVLSLARPYAGAAQTQALTPERPSRIGRIDESSLTLLKGNRHPLANAANDRGEVAPDLPMERMLLVLKRDPSIEPALGDLLSSQQDKASPAFHAWLSPEQVAARFGPSPSDLQTIASWLTSHGFQVRRIARGAMAIEFSGAASQVKEAFHAPIHSYAVGGEIHYANALDPQIPAALATVVAGVSTLNNFQKRPTIHPLGPAARIANSSLWQPEFTFNPGATPEHFLAPGDFAKIFNTAALYAAGIDGTGQSIAIVARNNINLSDIQIFRIAFGLPVNDPTVILDGPDPGNFLGSADESEADLDVEWSGAIAPKATIDFVVSASTNATDGSDLSAQYIVDNNIAPVLSMSFGQCEATLGQAQNQFFNNLWAQAAAQGITAVISSGDSGAAGCDDPNFGPAVQGAAVSGLASTPFNVAVGGTQFAETGSSTQYWSAANGPDQSSALGYIPEAAWNESCSDINQCLFISLFAGGGGPSSIYAKPSWQAGPGVANDGKRDLPDLSLSAAAEHDGYLLCQDGACLTDSNGQLINAFIVGGTSAAAPTFAAIMALVDQKMGARQGQADFVLYPLAAGESAANCNSSTGPQSSCIFNDVTQGNTNVPGEQGYAAGPAYDMATGLGSVNAANLVGAWKNATFTGTNVNLQLSPVNITHGQAVTATVSVTPASGTGTPSGDVALLTSSQTVNLGMVAAGTLSQSVTILPGGNYSITASYGGDGKFGASASNPPIAVAVAPESSSTAFSTLGPALTPSTSTTYGQFFYLQANVSEASGQGTATGTVSFADTFNGSTSTLLTAPLNVQGSAVVQEASLSIGTHTVTASYSGDASFKPSASGPVTVTVTKGLTQTILLAPPGAPPSLPLTLQAFVFPNGLGVPTGTVQFTAGSEDLGNPVPLQNSIATFNTSQLPAGSNSITAIYSGDSNFNPSTSPPSVVYVGNPDFTIAVNPGTLTVSSATPGTATVFLSPAPVAGFGFAGTVSLGCSGLPSGTICSFQPTQLNLDGSTVMTSTVTISKGATTGVRHLAGLRRWREFPTSRASIALLTAFLALVLLLYAASSDSPRASARTVPLVAALVVAGCGGGSSSPSAQTTTPSFAIVTITASGGSLGGVPVAHSVTLAVSLQ